MMEGPSDWFREMRHNRCLMTPVSVLCLLVFLLFSLFTLLLKFPTFLLGLFLAPFLNKAPLFIEFLYPMGIARWAHLYLVRMNAKKRKDKMHSRTLEQRFEVIKDRVYIHPIPQLLDNIAYLVVCLPGAKPADEGTSVEVVDAPIVAFLVDCGDAQAAADQIAEIEKQHYHKQTIQLQSLLCTHKHHDHTAGNRGMLALSRQENPNNPLKVYGGAVERVPFCNAPVQNGDFLDLPQMDQNDMNEVVEVEVIAVPGHTRGSVAYNLRAKTPAAQAALSPSSHSIGGSGRRRRNRNKNSDNTTSPSNVTFCFTGDTLFSGGSGVPFEADIQPPSDQTKEGKVGTSHIRASAGSNAIERCFAELIVRGISDKKHDKLLFFPGHEYTSELLHRQFMPGTSSDAFAWNRFAPSHFFETASQLFVANHRRNLAKDGKVLVVPTHLDRELKVNPTYRQMLKRGEEVVKALRLWNLNFARGTISRGGDFDENGHFRKSPSSLNNSTGGWAAPSSETQWNVGVEDVENCVFTTVFTKDLDSLIYDLSTGKLQPKHAASKLEGLKNKMNQPTVGRRPIPGTLPTQKAIYQALLAMALLGSAPSAMTVSDSRTMRLPRPYSPRRNDKIMVSRTRLIKVLTALGVLQVETLDGQEIIKIINLLWQESLEYGYEEDYGETTASASGGGDKNGDSNGADFGTFAMEESMADEVELGVLKWMLYGVQTNSSFLGKICMPCSGSKGKGKDGSRPHPIHFSKKRRTNGELVKHDIMCCRLCQDATGCPHLDYDTSLQEQQIGSSHGGEQSFGFEMRRLRTK